ncbi:lycopene cyclase family protein [Tessaracoccus oleiagri]|uniref:Lycopene beta-cyclase n=1 Tax=Tessaracoccus oleiagri TaxID=686624 RepID=A0A1G9I3P9_9ACTN|nr:lycopene cyclase family protein [Tessaracoccus oleiagri]SDL19712.1 lycopene beta-cyclase [Tessaracoccus oleiagri]
MTAIPTFDVAIAGLGPAGRALASRCAAQGLRVLAVDPRPEAVWTPTYGIWGDELGDLPESVVRSRISGPEIRARGTHRLARDYLVLDNATLQAALPLDGVELRRGRLDDAGVRALGTEARVVVDARGARPDGRVADDPAPAQTAYGIVVPEEAAAPALQGAAALLMDWRTDWSARKHPTGTPSFLYAIPLGDGTVLLEETCLAAAPGMPIDELRARLRHRLLARGVDAGALESPIDREVVRIPMRGRGAPPPDGALAIGTAGRGGNLVTGYSVAHSLRVADPLAKRIAAGKPVGVDPFGPADVLREMGLRALLRLGVDGTLGLFDAFGRLPSAAQRAFMSRDSGHAELAGAMWGMFRRMSVREKGMLIAATLGPPRLRRGAR